MEDRFVKLPLKYSGVMTRCYATSGLQDEEGHLIKTAVKWTEKGLEFNGKYYQTPGDLAKGENLSVFTSFSDALKACKKGLVVTTNYKYGLAEKFENLSDEQKEGVLTYVRNLQKQSSQLCIVHSVKYNGIFLVPVDVEKGHNKWSERERVDLPQDIQATLKGMQLDGSVTQAQAIAALAAQVADKASDTIVAALRESTTYKQYTTSECFGLPQLSETTKGRGKRS